MENRLIEDAFWKNLILLGFDKELFEKQYNMSFNKEMFRNSNIKGMEILLYFLLRKIAPEKVKEV
jgi:hypothetical protein